MTCLSWTHKTARLFVLPLINTPITPNHLTVLRLVTGIIACVAFASGIRYWEVLGGFIWILSALLDCADGELARMRNQCSEWGHKFDYFSDVTVTALFFVGIGIGARDSIPELIAIIMGLVAASGVIVAEVLAERIDQLKKVDGEKAYPGIAGFNFDDILFLFAVIVWLDWQQYFLIGTSVGAPIFALLTMYKLRQFYSENHQS
jgi:phosphatidylglycerophosphate synthase